MRTIDMIGKTFGRLKVLLMEGKSQKNCAKYLPTSLAPWKERQVAKELREILADLTRPVEGEKK